MKKICFLVGDISKAGGTERVTTLIANELSKKYDITIITIRGDGKSFFKICDEIKVVNLEIKNYLDLIIKLRKKLLEEEINILIEVDTILRLFSVFSTFFLNIKVISWEHFNFFSPESKYKRKIARFLSAKFSNQIITLTQEDKKYYNKNMKLRAKIEFIYNPTSYERRDIFSDIKENRIIVVGRLTEQKGYMELLKIWKILQNFTSYTLDIFGEGEQKEEIEKIIVNEKISRIRLLGKSNNIESELRKSKLYFMTSKYEGLPMVLIEAQSLGVPIVSYDIKTGPKDIIEDGINGFLIPNLNRDLFIEKALEVINNPIKMNEMSKNSYKISKKFSMKNIIQKWERVIEGLE